MSTTSRQIWHESPFHDPEGLLVYHHLDLNQSQRVHDLLEDQHDSHGISEDFLPCVCGIIS